jgi:hypothetical protein
MASLLRGFPRFDFQSIVDEYHGDKGMRTLSTYHTLTALLYGQVTSAFGMREIVKTLEANRHKLYHSGLSEVKRSTLSDALEKRNQHIFERAFYCTLDKAHQLSGRTRRKFHNPLKIIDATTIDLCLKRFDWAKFRRSKGAVKIHLCYDADSYLPDQVRLSTGEVHDVRMLNRFHLEEGEIGVVDRGYLDFNRLHSIHLRGAYFVTRIKKNTKFQILEKRQCPAGGAVRSDCLIRLGNSKAYPEVLRLVEYYDEEYERTYLFLTNNLELSAQQIADIYKERWQIELFFKWLKQNLKIKTFWGTSRNAVFIQIWVALILYLLLWMMKAIHGFQITLQKLLQVLKTIPFDRRPVAELLSPRKTSPTLDLNYCLWGSSR